MTIPLTPSILCPVLIGRGSQLATLSGLLDQAKAGQGQIALICGEAGIGKSRLTAEVKHLAAGQNWVILQGACFEPDRTLPYAPFIDLLQAARHTAASATDLAMLLSGEQNQPTDGAEQTKRRLFSALTGFLLDYVSAEAWMGGNQASSEEERGLPDSRYQPQLAARTSLLIILEDLHWCDDSSLEFLHVLARRLVDRPILLVLTYRSTEMISALQQLLAYLDRLRVATEINLSRLLAAEAEAMMLAIFAQGQLVQPEFAARIFELTEGNPFFVEETLRSLVATGEIYLVDGRWARNAIDQLHVPRTVQVAVAQRTAQLSEAARRVLVLAAVAGRRFDFALLQAITGYDEAHLVELIKELLRAQLVVEETAERFAFRHALTQQAIYRDLMRRERRPLHRAVAESMEQIYAAERDTHSGDLAAHFYAAEVWEKTLPYAWQAGERANALFAPQAAIEQFTRAIFAAQSLGRTSPALVPLSLLFRQRGQAYEWLGRFEDARADYRASLAAAHTEQNREAVWQAQIDLGFLWAQRDYTQAGDFFAQALAAARQMDDPSRLAHTLKRLGNWHMNVEHPDQSLSMLHEALQIFEALGDPRGIAETLDLQGIAHFAAANAIDGSRYYARAIEHFRQLGDAAGELNSLVVYAPRHARGRRRAGVGAQAGHQTG
jgi:predicted ATPase